MFPTHRIGARAPLAGSLVLLAGGLVLVATADSAAEVEDVVDVAMLMLFPLLGCLLVLRGQALPVARICNGIGLTTGLGFLAGGYSEHPWEARQLAALVASACFFGTLMLLMTALPLRFPDGTLPSPRWLLVSRLGGVVFTLGLVGMMFTPGPVDEDNPELGVNPWGINALAPVLEPLELIAFVGFAGLALLSIVSLVVRFRRSSGTARHQIAILVAGVATLVGLFLLDSTLQAIGGQLYGVVAAVVALAAVPLAMAIALLRVPASPRPTQVTASS